jgi:hypothetical protein
MNPQISTNGTKVWYNDKGEFHRLDGPAIEWIKGRKDWCINNKTIYSLGTDGSSHIGKDVDMTDIPLEMKQSIIEHTLKL